jgi:hypothetical protein
MSFTRLAEARIRQAIKDGEFENLPNSGQPLDLEEYFSAPAELRMAYSILKNANCVPVEVEILKDIARLEAAIDGESHSVERANLQRKLADRKTELAVRLERRRKGER